MIMKLGNDWKIQSKYSILQFSNRHINSKYNKWFPISQQEILPDLDPTSNGWLDAGCRRENNEMITTKNISSNNK